MGCVASISKNSFPIQGRCLNKRVEVIFHYDDSCRLRGVIVRDDMESPYKRIIHLDIGLYVLDTECQYMLVD